MQETHLNKLSKAFTISKERIFNISKLLSRRILVPISCFAFTQIHIFLIYGKAYWPSDETFLVFSRFQYQNFLKTPLVKVFELLYASALKDNGKSCMYT